MEFWWLPKLLSSTRIFALKRIKAVDANAIFAQTQSCTIIRPCCNASSCGWTGLVSPWHSVVVAWWRQVETSCGGGHPCCLHLGWHMVWERPLIARLHPSYRQKHTTLTIWRSEEADGTIAMKMRTLCHGHLGDRPAPTRGGISRVALIVLATRARGAISSRWIDTGLAA